ncbi:muscarinic acetylcholine receptor M3 [Striga asiatica]|uniref:Muscarinic acetylcholine receptor M3 n=1 Tax=Striga asiatica TaxID=4170 RepID=A0A5A7Q1D6_STRAF|nr:muscarinic acetylcholine receptor M3 [Striga asiatica]
MRREQKAMERGGSGVLYYIVNNGPRSIVNSLLVVDRWLPNTIIREIQFRSRVSPYGCNIGVFPWNITMNMLLLFWGTWWGILSRMKEVQSSAAASTSSQGQSTHQPNASSRYRSSVSEPLIQKI